MVFSTKTTKQMWKKKPEWAKWKLFHFTGDFYQRPFDAKSIEKWAQASLRLICFNKSSVSDWNALNEKNSNDFRSLRSNDWRPQMNQNIESMHSIFGFKPSPTRLIVYFCMLVACLLFHTSYYRFNCVCWLAHGIYLSMTFVTQTVFAIYSRLCALNATNIQWGTGKTMLNTELFIWETWYDWGKQKKNC